MLKISCISIIVLIVALVLVGCSFVRAEQPIYTDFVTLSTGETAGQTFMARNQGLSSFDIYLKPELFSGRNLVLNLYHTPTDEQPISTSNLSLTEAYNSGYYSFEFPPQINSNNQDYYVELMVMDEGQDLKLAIASGDAYINGALYKNKEPIDSQLTFQLSYDPVQAILGLGSLGLSWLWFSIVGTFLFVIPGWAILCLLMPGWKSRFWAEKLGLSIGVSLAIYPLLLLWTNLFGLNLGALYAWAPPLVGLLVLVWKNRKNIKKPNIYQLRSPKLLDITLIIIIVLLFNVRFWIIRNIDIPMWGDSYHHTMISQLLVDNGGLFNDWQPYSDIKSLTYHFGFHSLVSVFHWITKLSLPQATLWTGQLLNGLAVLALYPIAVRLGKNPWAGVVAVLIAGLLSPMPMFYFNWGRYTQLAGLAIFPVTTYLLWKGLEGDTSFKWRYAILIWITFAGLALTHYRVFVLGIIFILAYFIIYIRRTTIISALERTIFYCVGAGILFLPWFIHVFSGRIFHIFGAQMTTSASQVPTSTVQYNAIGDLLSYLPGILWFLFLLALGWGLWRRSKGVALIGFWWLIILIVANPQFLRLPGTGAINNFMVFISAFMPVSTVTAAATIWLISDIKRAFEVKWIDQKINVQWSKQLPSIVLLALLTLVAVFGARTRIKDSLVDDFSLVTRPDIRAATWINENLPENSNMLVNSFFAYGGTAIAGSDGGWWLPHRQWVNALTAEIQSKGINHPDVLAMLDERKVTHVYIGQQQGLLGDGRPSLSPQEVLASPHFSLIYHQDRVWIFEVGL